MPVAPRAIIIAGPNGAGKTTFASEFLQKEANCPIFINADVIAARLAPHAPETFAQQAGRQMLFELAQHTHNRHDFAIETTMAGRT